MTALAAGTPAGIAEVKGVDPAVLEAATGASRWVYARAYRLAWISIVPFVVLALVCVACLKGVKELMTERVEATVEDVGVREEVKREAA